MFSLKFIICLISLNYIGKLNCQSHWDDGGNGEEFKDPHFYSDHLGIVQMFQWPFKYIARECEEYLGPQGFGGVQVSPIFENRIVDGRPWFELYQPISYKIKTRLGDENEFRDMIKRCNNVGVRVYVDTILNHMAAGKGTLKGAAGSKAYPTLRKYPAVPYTSSDFHPCCTIKNWSSKTEMQKCKLLELPDLNQSKSRVQSIQIKMLNNLISMGVAGFRVDALSFMVPDDLQAIFSKLNNLPTEYNFADKSKPFFYHEAHSWKSDYVKLGRIIEFKYQSAVNSIMRGKYILKHIDNFESVFDLLPGKNVISSLSDHDSERTYNYLSYKDPIPYKMGLAFLFGFSYGVPKIISSFAFNKIADGPPADINSDIIDPRPGLYGQCQMNWNCEHRYHVVSKMLQFAKAVQTEPVRNLFGNDDGQFGFCRGNKGFIAFNTGTKDMEIEMNVCLSKGTYCDITSGSNLEDMIEKLTGENKCKGAQIDVNENGKAIVRIPANDEKKFVAFYTV